MKFVSLKNLAQNAGQVIKRFPVEMFYALIATIAGVINIELKHDDTGITNTCIRLMMTANLGLLLSFATTLFCLGRGISGIKQIILKTGAILLSILLFFLINPFVYQTDIIRFFSLSFTLHLLVAYAAFLKPSQVPGFWQFNKTLFLRFLTGALYSTVLYGGIAAAMASMTFLFNITITSSYYMILWIVIAFLFNTLFFLSGVPKDLQELNQDFSYPKGLKIFTQYVLIPLATLYVIILISYEVKILISWNLPKGLVSSLILGYAVFGILSVLLVFPIRGQEENKWIKTYARSFYLLMLPLLILLFLAIGTRIFNYGITPSRYFLILLSLWLLFITLYFLYSKKQNIKLIPISLSIFALLSIYGPQSAFSISKYSQRNILIQFFKQYNSFTDGRFIPVHTKKIKSKDGGRAISALDYLLKNYGTDAVEPYLNISLNKITDSLNKLKGKDGRLVSLSHYEKENKKEEWVRNYLGLDKFNGYDETTTNKQQYVKIGEIYNFSVKQKTAIQVSGFDYFLEETGIAFDSLKYKDENINIQRNFLSKSKISIEINGEKTIFDLPQKVSGLIKDISKIGQYAYVDPEAFNDDKKLYQLPDNLLMINNETKNYIITFKITDITSELKNTKEVKEVLYFHGYYLIKKK